MSSGSKPLSDLSQRPSRRFQKWDHALCAKVFEVSTAHYETKTWKRRMSGITETFYLYPAGNPARQADQHRKRVLRIFE